MSCLSLNYILNSEGNRTKMTDKGEKDKKVDLGLLEEDDEFEEFPTEEWKRDEEDPSDNNVWEDNWDDDNVEDDFSMQLRAELEKHGHKVNNQEQEPMRS